MPRRFLAVSFFFPWFFFLFTALTPDGNDVAAGADHVRTRKAGKQEPSNGKAAHNLTTLNSSTTWLHDFIPFTDCAVPCRKYSSYILIRHPVGFFSLLLNPIDVPPVTHTVPTQATSSFVRKPRSWTSPSRPPPWPDPRCRGRGCILSILEAWPTHRPGPMPPLFRY